MLEYTVMIDGMQCAMCEAHINDAIRQAFPIKKVSSTHSKGQTTIITENTIDEAALQEVIANTGYQVVSITSGPYHKKGLFSKRNKYSAL